MLRFIGKTVRFVIGTAALLSVLALMGVLWLWYDSKETVHVGRFGGAEVGYYDLAFNKGQVQVTGIRRSVRELSPHWLTLPAPTQEMTTANPLVLWDLDQMTEKDYQAGIRYRRGLAQWRPTGMDDEVLTEPRTGHAVIMPAWVAVAALAVVPALWLLIAIPTRALRRRRLAAQERERSEGEAAQPTQPKRGMATA